MSHVDTLTIFCCGTNFTRGNLDETVAHTYTLTQGRKWINDGPGSMDKTIIRSEAIMKKVAKGKNPGTKRMPFDEKGKVNPKAYRVHTKETNIEGSVKGGGTADNIINTLQWLWLEYGSTQIDPVKAGRPKMPEFNRINLVGWSRGAVTCIMLAHAIKAAGFQTKIPTLKVNIFAFDPVPGYSNDFKTKGKFEQTGRAGSTTSLPSIVQNYNAILMEHISGWTVPYILSKDKAFQCVSPRFRPEEAEGRKKRDFPLSGEHGDCVMFNRPNNPAGKIGLHLCHKFLKENGTDMTRYEMLKNASIIENYSELRMKYASGAQHRKVLPTKFRKKLVMNTKRYSSYFVNLHHYEVFQLALPRTLAELNKGKVTNTTVLTNLYPKTYDALNTLGYI